MSGTLLTFPTKPCLSQLSAPTSSSLIALPLGSPHLAVDEIVVCLVVGNAF